MSISAKLRNLGIEGLKDKINIKIDRIPSIPKFLNPLMPELDLCPIFMQDSGDILCR